MTTWEGKNVHFGKVTDSGLIKSHMRQSEAVKHFFPLYGRLATWVLPSGGGSDARKKGKRAEPKSADWGCWNRRTEEWPITHVSQARTTGQRGWGPGAEKVGVTPSKTDVKG